MQDLQFRYALMARARRDAFWRRLILADTDWLGAGLQDVSHSAAADIRVTGQYERIGWESVTKPASKRHSVFFYPEADPTRPQYPHFERKTERFPLQHSLRVEDCSRCHATGQVSCSCNNGKVECGTCWGSGKVETGNGNRPCSTCYGRRVVDHGLCGGTGQVRCPRCEGETIVATWSVQVHTFSTEDFGQQLFPDDPPSWRLKRAFGSWLDHGLGRIGAFDPQSFEGAVGYANEDTELVRQRAVSATSGLEQQAANAGGYHWHVTWRRAAPCGRLRVRDAERRHDWWLVGSGAQAVEVRPVERPDAWKVFGWLGVGGIASAVGLAIEGLDPILVTLLAAGSVLATALLPLRMRRKGPRYRLVALLSPSAACTGYLSCLVSAGARLDAVSSDQTWEHHFKALDGGVISEACRTLTLHSADGSLVRMIEVSGRMDQLEGVDGVVVLDDGSGGSSALARTAADAGFSPVVASIGEGSLDHARSALRECVEPEAGWQALFDRLWEPVARAAGLEGKE